MQKVFTDVTVTTKGGNTYSFWDSNTSIDGTSAMRSLNQKIAIDATENESIKRTFIPYEAIDNAVIEHSLGSEFTPQDANCVVKQDAAEPGTLTITNNSANALMVTVFLKLGQPGTYSGYEFTRDASEITGEAGWYTTNSMIEINAGATITIRDLPDGISYAVNDGGGSGSTGTIPAAISVSGGIK